MILNPLQYRLETIDYLLENKEKYLEEDEARYIAIHFLECALTYPDAVDPKSLDNHFLQIGKNYALFVYLNYSLYQPFCLYLYPVQDGILCDDPGEKIDLTKEFNNRNHLVSGE